MPEGLSEALSFDIPNLLHLPAVILAAAAALEMLLPFSAMVNLSSLVPTFQALAKKVNNSSHSLSQRYFSGFMLPFLILVIFLLLLGVLELVSGFDLVVSLVLLVFLLRFYSTQNLILKIKELIDRQEIQKARRILSDSLLRDTEKLSAMGLCKAGCEHTVLKLFSSWFAVMVWFLILGDAGALIMALSCVFCEAFNMKDPEYGSFGTFSSRLQQSLLIVPALVFTILTLATRHPVNAVKEGLNASKTYPVKVSGYILGLMGFTLNISLGGPRYYMGYLYRYQKVGSLRDPEALDLIKVLRRMRSLGLLLITAAFLITVCLEGLITNDLLQGTGSGQTMPVLKGARTI